MWALFRAVYYGINLDLENFFGNFVRVLVLIHAVVNTHKQTVFGWNMNLTANQ